MANLSWKLQAVLQGGAQAALLDTYGSERQAHVTDLTTRIKHIGQLIGERDLSRARARDAELLDQCGGVVKPTPRQDVQPALRTGLLAHQESSARGTLFPQPWLHQPGGPDRRMDDVYGCGWRLVMAQGADPAWAKLARRRSDSALCIVTCGGDGLQETQGVLQAWFDRHQTLCALVRPDHYVYGTATDASGVASWFDELSAFSSRAA